MNRLLRTISFLIDAKDFFQLAFTTKIPSTSSLVSLYYECVDKAPCGFHSKTFTVLLFVCL